MIYRVLSKKQEYPKKVHVENEIIWMCSLCKKAYGPGEIILQKGRIDYYCLDCPDTSLSWLKEEEFLNNYNFKQLN